MRFTRNYRRGAATLTLLTLGLLAVGNAAPLMALRAGCFVERVTITGYFTPIEADYSGRKVPVETTSGTLLLREDFLTDFHIEWMGITDSGNVIGKWESGEDAALQIHQNLPQPLDGIGEPLRPFDAAAPEKPGTAAANFLPLGTMVRVIENPLNPLSEQPLYEVTDTIGGPNDPLHIDLYLGEGAAAKQRTYGVSELGGSGTICVF